MGVCAAIGYGIGTSVGWLIRRIRKRSEWAADHRTRIVVGLMVAMVLAMAWGAGVRWQSALADISGCLRRIDGGADLDRLGHRGVRGPACHGPADPAGSPRASNGAGRLAPDVMARGPQR